ncbi:unnamed protein product [Gongylonema pulchrum]|uniref:Uncharacterized protein n=1 Tax=Gongylonema pulchrum TaxID=637853 RepID=A0A183DBB1_9BILA|nr:unnamed protein product [Gongylonema pulchrum]
MPIKTGEILGMDVTTSLSPSSTDLRKKRKPLKPSIEIQLEKAAEMLDVNRTSTPKTGIISPHDIFASTSRCGLRTQSDAVFLGSKCRELEIRIWEILAHIPHPPFAPADHPAFPFWSSDRCGK